jgi:hypothetical protein
MKTSTTKKAAANRRLGRADPALDGVFDAYPKPVKAKLLALRRLILDTAKATQGVGELEEPSNGDSRAISRPRARAAARFVSTR